MLKKSIKWILLSLLLIAGLQSTSLVAEENESHFYYYILIDRFENGDPQSDPEDIDREDPTGFHGGDYQGIENNIEHLQEIGVTHVILSPIFESADYLGQEALSFERLQSSFGEEEELSNLVDSLHKAEIEVLTELPLHQINENSELAGRDWVQANGEVDLSNENAVDYFSETVGNWMEQLNLDGYYVGQADELPIESLQSLQSNLDGHWVVGMSDEEAMQAGVDVFDQLIRFGESEETFERFKGFDADFTALVNQPLFDSENVGHYIDFLHTDRFTRALEDTGNHPVTRWKMALTYLFTVTNDPVLFQGSEIPMDGSIDDRSTHAMLNFLAGDEQVTRHVEKLSSARENYRALREGDMNVIQAEDGFLAYSRTMGDEEIIVTINTTQKDQELELTELESGKELRGHLENDLVREDENGVYRVVTNREASNIFVVGEDSGVYWPLTLVFVGVMGIFIFFAVYMYRKKNHKI